MATLSVDLSSCAKEPIHTPGRVQSFAALLVADPETGAVLQRSANLDELTGLEPAETLEGTLPPGPLSAARGALKRGAALVDRPALIYTGPLGSLADAHVVAHLRDERLLLEIEPAAGDARDWIGEVNEHLRTLGEAASLDALCDGLAAAVRVITGYDRVMVYRFDDDDSGWVSAEDRREDLEPFLGLHYPASDIPPQARALYLKSRTRVLEDRAAAPSPMHPERLPGGGLVDMGFAQCRGMSPIHLEYLANMGVRATLTLSLSRPGADRLWGLIACHHYAGPKPASVGLRTACDVLAQSASFLIDATLLRDRVAAVGRATERHAAIARAMAASPTVLGGVRACEGELAPLIDAPTFCAFDGERLHQVGETVDEAWARSLVDALASRTDRVFASDALPEVPREESAAGALAVRFPHAPDAWLVWLRPERAREVRWAGDPSKPVEVGRLGARLTPRGSFSEWVERVEGRSARWTDIDRALAERLSIALSDVVYQERDRVAALRAELAAQTAALESFTTMASHDLREPLRGIASYASFLREDAEGQIDEEASQHIAHIERLVERMYGLIEDMLALSRLSRAELTPGDVDLDALVAQVLFDVEPRARERDATIVVEELPTIVTWSAGVRTALENLLVNAMKYSDGPPHVTIGVTRAGDVPSCPATADPEHVALFVRDRGIGVDPRHHRDLFRMFHRLYPDGRYGDGTGAGLAIVRRAVERMGGEVWLESTVGEGSCFYLTVPSMSEGAR